MKTVDFKVLGVHEYGWYAYAEDDIFILGDSYPHEGGELYRGEFKEDKIPYLNEFKKDCPEAYDNAVKYFNSRPKNEDFVMKNYRVMVIKYGYAVVEAKNEAEALELIDDMQDNDFDWSDFDDGQVVEEIDYQ